MVATRRMIETRRKAALEPDSDSEADAPEQETLSSGRDKAQKLRQEERESQKRVQAEAKQRRQRNVVKKKEEAPSDSQEEATVVESLEEASANPAQVEHDEQEVKFAKSGKISGFLDTSIIDFLSSQERKGGEVRTSTPEDKNTRMRHRTGKRKRNKEIISSSRVKVVLLEGNRPSSANYQGALEFKNKRFFGERVHRSLKMLSPKPTSV